MLLQDISGMEAAHFDEGVFRSACTMTAGWVQSNAAPENVDGAILDEFLRTPPAAKGANGANGDKAYTEAELVKAWCAAHTRVPVPEPWLPVPSVPARLDTAQKVDDAIRRAVIRYTRELKARTRGKIEKFKLLYAALHNEGNIVSTEHSDV
jgi:hypothetical protein